LIHGFEDAMSLREAADHGLTFSEGGAKDVIHHVKEFLLRAKEILKNKRLNRVCGF
jgi:uncharacterized protein (UPF0332 family)